MASERSAAVRRPESGRRGTRIVATLCVATSAALVLPAMPAGAAPKETKAQAEARLKKLNSVVDKLDDNYNKAMEDWKAAKAKLTALNKSVAQQKKTFEAMRLRVAQMASSAYKNNDMSIPQFVGSSDPAAVLDQMSLFTQLSRNRATQVGQFLNAAQLLQRQQSEAGQAAAELTKKKNELSAQRKKLLSKVNEQKAILAKYGSPAGSSGGSGGGTYTGPATGSARAVVQFALDQVGDPYVFGGTGPNSWDCSGLVQAAWKAGGVSLPRVVPEQFSATRRVSRADLQPGDIVFFESLGHDGIYIGNGMLVHAPQTGELVSKVSLSGWFSSNYSGAGRP